jgi:hypothetical protein
MTAKKTLVLSISSSVLAFILSEVYIAIYNKAFFVDYSMILSLQAVAGACFVGGFLLGWGNFLFLKFNKKWGQFTFNLLAGILSFASILGPLATTLPTEIEFPEMFPGLAATLHFFPVLAHLALLPLFIEKTDK